MLGYVKKLFANRISLFLLGLIVGFAVGYATGSGTVELMAMLPI